MLGVMPIPASATRKRPLTAPTRPARITIWLPGSKRAALESLARESDLTLTQLARRGIDRVLADADRASEAALRHDHH